MNMLFYVVSSFIGGVFLMSSYWAKLLLVFCGGFYASRNKDKIWKGMCIGGDFIKDMLEEWQSKKKEADEDKKIDTTNEIVEKFQQQMERRIDAQFDRISRQLLYRDLSVVRCPHCDHWTSVNKRPYPEGCEFCGRVINHKQQ